MTILDLFLLAFLFLLVGGWQQMAERCRELLDFLRPPQAEQPPIPVIRRRFHEPPPPDAVEQPLPNGASMPPPPAPDFAPSLYPNLFEQDENGNWRERRLNPDFETKATDADLGGVQSHIPGEPEDEQ